MARSRLSARKTTGGMAPRRKLAKPNRKGRRTAVPFRNDAVGGAEEVSSQHRFGDASVDGHVPSNNIPDATTSGINAAETTVDTTEHLSEQDMVERWKESHNSADLDATSLLNYTDLSAAAHRLPLIVTPNQTTGGSSSNEDLAAGTSSSNNAVEPSAISSMPVFDLGTISDGSYILSRKTTQLKDSVSDHANEFLRRILKRAKTKYKHSKWVIIWKNEDTDGFTILPQEECQDGEYSELEHILESGELNGCDLRGNSATCQYGLVANKDLANNTFVAVECGVVWSEPIHDRMIENQGDPLLGLSSNLVPARLLRQLSDKRTWKRYKRECTRDGNSDSRKIPGFVVESSFRGNETKHIDDPGWLYMTAGGSVENKLQHEPNLEARVVLNLDAQSLTVGFETNRNVKQNTELTMDWGCWGKICDCILPGHAQVSIIAFKCKQALESIAQSSGITLKDELESGHITQGDSAVVYFSPKESTFSCLEKVDAGMGKYLDVGDKLGQGFSLLEDIMNSNVGLADNFDGWCKPYDYDKRVYRLFAEVSSDTKRLSLPARRKMRDVPCVASTGFSVTRTKLLETFEANIEVVEITDPSNPAKLFELPDRPALALRAKRKIRKNSPVIAYGGIISQLDDQASRDGYVFDLAMPEEYEGPPLHIDGRRGIGGMINDPWTPSGYAKREANLVAVEHWDEQTNTPQIVLYATRCINRGEELLYNYGYNFWKVGWIMMMREHAEYSAETAIKCRSYREQILSHSISNISGVNDLEHRIIDVMQSMKSENLANNGISQSTLQWGWGVTGWTNNMEDALPERELRGGKQY